MSKESREQYLRQLIEVSPIACILTDPKRTDNPIIAVNDAFVRLTGYAHAEILGQNCRFLGGDRAEPAARATLRSAIAAGKSAVVELTNFKRDGTSFRNAVMIAPFFEQGELTFFLGSQMEVEPDSVSGRREIAKGKIARLSPRQVQVLRYMAGGLRHAQIASALGVGEKTVKMHRAALVAKLDCATSAEAIRIAIEAGL
jgi:PAS domain S-box-containing protein